MSTNTNRHPSSEWNPRYEAYAAAHGRTVDEQARADNRADAGKMTGYIVWIGQQWEAYRLETGLGYAPTPERQHAFDVWLTARVAAAASPATVRCFSCSGRGTVRFMSALVHTAFATGRGKLVRCERCGGRGRRPRRAEA